MLISSGSFNFLLAFALLPVVPNRMFLGESLGLAGYLSLPVCICNTVFTFWSVARAVELIKDPTLVGMLRSTEILFSLITDSIINLQFPDIYTFIGSIIVLSSVCGMTVHDTVMKKLDQIFRSDSLASESKEDLKKEVKKEQV